MNHSLFRGGPFTGRHMLMIMIAFFGVVISVNLTLAFFASKSWTGLVVQNSYVASQNFEKERVRQAAQMARGWQIGANVEDGFLTVTLKDGDGKSIERAAVTASLSGVMYDRDDQTVELPALARGGYGREVQLHAGEWIAELTVDARGLDPWQGSVRFSVPNSEVGAD
ncbi:FixH family protein [Notoacmeibacter sp. MSK16QG-6]|uniref:FixH family protein n=1 Tax=Notoacmeibacter sp. MSK16QG-6 TaxID=2957982 RepID=UPI00209CEB8B|nr:FixH family protein [Notoacmeibacter sp. MSK16QG-6]MCP1198658.1 FixH family protein [Notoacmeibacter sp. MSK16QG-6]